MEPVAGFAPTVDHLPRAAGRGGFQCGYHRSYCLDQRSDPRDCADVGPASHRNQHVLERNWHSVSLAPDHLHLDYHRDTSRHQVGLIVVGEPPALRPSVALDPAAKSVAPRGYCWRCRRGGVGSTRDLGSPLPWFSRSHQRPVRRRADGLCCRSRSASYSCNGALCDGRPRSIPIVGPRGDLEAWPDLASDVKLQA